jgi:thiamine biosynthesis lipoprotein
MGTVANIETVGGSPDLVELAKHRLDELEQRWSRFLPSSDISRLNKAGGRRRRVDRSTVTLVRAMLDGHAATEGAFDPTLLSPLVGLGYAASWTDPARVTSLANGVLPRGDVQGVRIGPGAAAVQLPAGTVLDPGGIGKGLAADLITAELLEAGASGAMVCIGGDLRARGEGPVRGAWLIGVADPANHVGRTAVLRVADAGIATSGTTRRTWHQPGFGAAHHVLDPSTLRPTPRGLDQIVQATVVAGSAAWAEVFATAVLVDAGRQLGELDHRRLAVRIVHGDGRATTNSAWRQFDRSGPRGENHQHPRGRSDGERQDQV